jgi:arylsulfatase A-like enzyme
VCSASLPPNILHIVADDLGYDDLGHNSVMGNGGKSLTPNINELIDTGVALHEYYTFKVCSPTRASLLTGRYPWGAGFYDMSNDGDHCTSQFELLPAALKRTANYATYALGKWDIGYIVKDCSPTFSGFDTFLGYYSACLSDYWYHWVPGQCDQKGPYVDLSNR